MSWSLNLEGTKEAVKRELAAREFISSAATSTAAHEETTLFETVRSTLINFVDHAPEIDGSLTIVRAFAGGHGPSVSCLQFETRIVAK
jgi:hypothetical protein